MLSEKKKKYNHTRPLEKWLMQEQTTLRSTRWIAHKRQPRCQAPLSMGEVEPSEPVVWVTPAWHWHTRGRTGGAILHVRILRSSSALASQGRNKDTFLDVPCSKCLGLLCNTCQGRVVSSCTGTQRNETLTNCVTTPCMDVKTIGIPPCTGTPGQPPG